MNDKDNTISKISIYRLDVPLIKPYKYATGILDGRMYTFYVNLFTCYFCNLQVLIIHNKSYYARACWTLRASRNYKSSFSLEMYRSRNAHIVPQAVWTCMRIKIVNIKLQQDSNVY